MSQILSVVGVGQSSNRLREFAKIGAEEADMPLTRLIYFSENQIDPAAGTAIRTLSTIMSASNRNNHANKLTGALVFDNMWFLQALEGERKTVWQTFERIRDDDRHVDVVVTELVEIDSRIFGNWWMGLATRNEQTKHIFERLEQGALDPRRMTASQMLSLMVDLSKIGLSRELAGSRAA